MVKIYKNLMSTLNPDGFDALNAYLDERITMNSLALESQSDIDQIRKLQGALFELRQLKKLREKSISVLKLEK